jgi:hypothetical protein
VSVAVALALAPGEAEADDTGDPPRLTEPAAAAVQARRLSSRTDAVMAAYSAMYDGQLTTQDLRIRAGAPLVRRESFGLGLLLGYGATHWGFATDGGERDLALHRFEATLGGGGALAPGYSLRSSLGVAYGSDLRDATWSALQLTSSATLHRVLGPDDAIAIGAVYTSTGEFLPVLPILGYVHQRSGSPFRLDIFIPRHIRAEYELRSWIRGALGIEALGNTWIARAMQSQETVKRAGGTVFGELGFRLSPRTRLEARIGLAVTRHTLPALADAADEQALRPAGFAQLALLLVP